MHGGLLERLQITLGPRRKMLAQRDQRRIRPPTASRPFHLIVITESGNTECRYRGSYVPISNHLDATGEISCSNGLTGTFRTERLTVTADGLYSATLHQTIANVTTKLVHSGLYLKEVDPLPPRLIGP